MRRLIVLPVFTLAFVIVVALTVAGQSPEYMVGTWKTNVSKSTYSPGPPPKAPATSRWEVMGDGQFKNINEGVDAKGQPTHNEIIVKFDGTDRPLIGAAVPTTRTYKLIDARTFEFVTKVNGKVTTTFRSVLAPDGKTRTATTTGTNAQGQAVKSVVLWEKQ
jgi:hypothetical protein